MGFCVGMDYKNGELIIQEDNNKDKKSKNTEQNSNSEATEKGKEDNNKDK